MARNLFTTLIPLGRETRLIDDVLSPSAGVLDDGTVALFYVPGLDANLQVQRFGQFGRPLGDPIDLGPRETPAGGGVSDAHVAGLEGGGFVAAWTESFSQATTSHFAVVDAAGEVVTREDFGLGGRTSGLAAAGLPDGGFALVETRSGILAESASIVFQRFTAQGAPDGDLVTVAAQSGEPGTLSYSDPQAVAVDGGVQVLWVARDGVRAAFVDEDDAVQDARLIRAGLVDDLDAARLRDGNVVATWAEPSADGSVVRAAVFDPDRPDLAPRLVEVGASVEAIANVDPEVVGLAGGGWAVSWHDGDPDGRTVARTFGPQGAASPEFPAQGDFFGTAGRRVLSLRVDADDDVFLARYLEFNAPIFIPGLDRIALSLPETSVQAAQEWMI